MNRYPSSLFAVAIVTPEMKDQVEDVQFLKLNVARVASDPYPST